MNRVQRFVQGLGVFGITLVKATIVVGAIGVFLALGRLIGPLFSLPVAIAAGYTAYWWIFKGG